MDDVVSAYNAARTAERSWVDELRKAYGDDSGVARSDERRKGNPGSRLRKAYEDAVRSADAWYEASQKIIRKTEVQPVADSRKVIANLYMIRGLLSRSGKPHCVEFVNKAVEEIQRLDAENAKLRTEVDDAERRYCKMLDERDDARRMLKRFVDRMESARLKPKPMTLEEACCVLRDNEHGFCNDWFVVGNEHAGWYVQSGCSSRTTMSAFNAIAVAEKYLRDEGGSSGTAE